MGRRAAAPTAAGPPGPAASSMSLLRTGPVKGAGGERIAAENGDAGGAAPAAVRAAPTDEQKAQIEAAIKAATSLEEVQKLESAIRSGQFDVVAKFAAAAAANGAS